MQDAGTIRIELDLADGVVCSARVRVRRPLGVARLFLGRAAPDAPALAARLFTLCSRAQGAAAAAAVGLAGDAAQRRRLGLAVAAERLFETLRAGLAAFEGAGPPLRDAARAAQSLGRDGERAALDALAAAAARLGLGQGPPAPDSAFGRLLRQCARETGLALTPPDALSANDDAAVAEALAAAPERFAAWPQLPGRRPETGAFARVWPDVPKGLGALAARTQARLIDARRTLAELETLIAVNAAPAPGLIEAGTTACGAGFGAVESPRGRLYHWARVGAGGRIEAYAILAPTEWNFHPAGPLVADLVGARLGAKQAAQDAAEKLATLIDPCVGFEVAIREAA